MALHINLLHEIQSQKLQEKRDPLKLSVLFLIILATIMMGYYLFRLQSVKSISSRAANLRNKWEEISKKETAAKTRENELNALLAANAKLISNVEGRFYWAPVMEQLLQAVPPQIQITKFAGNLNQPNLKDGNIVIDGISAGGEPRAVAENFRLDITKRLAELNQGQKEIRSQFNSLEESDVEVMLNGQRWPAANFSIQISFAEIKAPEPTPAPSPAKRKRR